MLRHVAAALACACFTAVVINSESVREPRGLATAKTPAANALSAVRTPAHAAGPRAGTAPRPGRDEMILVSLPVEPAPTERDDLAIRQDESDDPAIDNAPSPARERARDVARPSPEWEAISASVPLDAAAPVQSDDILPSASPAPRYESSPLMPDPAWSGEPKRALSRAELCDVLRASAEAHGLPEPLFVRLIWQESRFRVDAVSPVGARGIAQFMPATAAERGLEDPFDPVQAIPASAYFLRELVVRFGNFGLAAAAYNGGPRRVSEWLAGKGPLPRETREYVIHITGVRAEHWAKAREEAAPHPEAEALGEDCRVPPIAAAYAALRNQRVWRAQLAANVSEEKARAAYDRLRKKYPNVLGPRHAQVVSTKTGGKGSATRTLVRISAPSRAEALSLCRRLREAGGQCTVTQTSASG